MSTRTLPLTITRATALRRGCCKDGVAAAIGRTVADDDPVALVDMIDAGVPLNDVVRACFVAGVESRRAYRHWILDVYEMRRLAAIEVLPIFERDRPGDDRPRRALDAYLAGYAAARAMIDGTSGGTLDDAVERALDAADAADAAYAAYVAYAADAAYAAYAADAAYAASAASAAYAAYAAYAADAAYAAYAAYAADAASADWRNSVKTWCRVRLRARLAGDVAPTADDPTLALILVELRRAVDVRLGRTQTPTPTPKESR